MPVVTIRALPQRGLDRTTAAKNIGAAIATAAGVQPTDIWIVWSDVESGAYVIAGAAPTAEPSDSHPPLVEISATSGRSAELTEAILQATARAVSGELRVPPENVRVLYAEIPPRRLFSRGRFQ